MEKTLKQAISRIQDFYKENKRVPTYKELTKMFGFASKNASYKLVQRLIDQDVLERDKTGKIIPKNLFEIPHPDLADATILTNDLRSIAQELLKATHPLAEAHPAPKSRDPFLRVSEATYRRNTFTLLAIEELSRKPYFADSAMALMRKMLEDLISIEYMIANDKQAMAKRFQRFMAVQLHQNTEFLKDTGANFAAAGIAEKPEEIEKEYQKVREEFIHPATKQDLRSWIGKDIETLLRELKNSGSMSEFDVSRTAIAYVRACWKNHFNPYDIAAYLKSDLLEASSQEAMNHALLFSVTCYYRLTTRYIDHVRHVTQENQFEEVAKKISKVWEKLNPKE